MTEATAKRHLRAMLRAFTAGTVLHLYSEVFAELAADAEREGDDLARQQYATVEQALYVFGCGVDSACPRQ